MLHVYYIPEVTNAKPYVQSPDLFLNTKELIEKRFSELVLEVPASDVVSFDFEIVPGYTADEITVVTVYLPNVDKWKKDFRSRK